MAKRRSYILQNNEKRIERTDNVTNEEALIKKGTTKQLLLAIIKAMENILGVHDEKKRKRAEFNVNNRQRKLVKYRKATNYLIDNFLQTVGGICVGKEKGESES